MSAPHESTSRRGRFGRRLLLGRDDHSGLSTLEWLLIVAAVAAMTALAIVIVQNVVGDTAEGIVGRTARATAALHGANEVALLAGRDAAEQPAAAKTFGDWKVFYEGRCSRINIMYGDAGIETRPHFLVRPNRRAEDVTRARIRLGSSDEPLITYGPPSNWATAQCQLIRQ